ncbi:alpha/beta hydrolase [Nocardia zapadnayensis]|uniref:alpha/beta hydrolase n=1 Tax=Nocardia rhamnosiphila TaxID=426716 RepID=UPI002247E91F|nr:alpha/beta hydrolase [Nocardia zapadnayensis]MCX0271895.1 alpha/beta hydrolase [Nocardia zapadnayensis]
MSSPAVEARLGAGRYIESAEIPAATITSAHELETVDGAKVHGVLRTLTGARTVVSLMHPRQDLTHHVLVPELLARGFAVWTQGVRSTNNDLDLIHEQALLDVAAGQVLLRDHGFDNRVTLGHSGGGTLFAFYHEQAALAPDARLRKAPSGRPVDLPSADMPVPDAAVFMAPHPGQGALLRRLIDPSVADEADPLSVVPELDPFSPANGFAAPGESSTYTPEFIDRYRTAQAERIARIDAEAKARVAIADEARARFKASSDPADRRVSLVPRVLTVYRTDADLRFVDLSIDPNERPYGSLFGRRPDLTNYGLVGFGRLVTPDAWMSTWSANTTNADFLRCAPAVQAPTLFVELTGDAVCFPSDATAMVAALGARDLEHRRVAGTHFGGPIHPGAPTGAASAAAEIGGWLDERFPA